MHLASSSVTTKTSGARASTFGFWCNFCQQLNIAPSLSDVPDDERRLAYLLVFGLRYHRYGRTKNPVQADTVATALGITDLGQPDPRKQADGSFRPLLNDFVSAMPKEDKPSDRAYPANVTILRALDDALDFEDAKWGVYNQVVRNLCIVGFFWLL